MIMNIFEGNELGYDYDINKLIDIENKINFYKKILLENERSDLLEGF